MRTRLYLILSSLHATFTCVAVAFTALVPTNRRSTKRWQTTLQRKPRIISVPILAMGWMDNFVPDFLKQRDGDFVKLDENDCAFGPGPLLIMYDAPDTIDDEEICDMMHDEAPDVGQCQIFRITSSSSYSSYSLLDLSLRDALEQISSGRSNLDVTAISNSEANESPQESLIPVLFFSGFRNSDMMAIYNILGKEIYQETAGQSTPACAKAVPNAMMKPLRQVLSEITGDHQDAIDMQKNDLRSFE